MGCCFSTPNSTQHQNGLETHQPQLRSNAPKSTANHEEDPRAPPPIEEESVKEVLSETPISKPQQVPILMAETKTQMPKTQHSKASIFNKAESEVSEEVSQISETCSISESFSTTTTATVTEKREDEATSKRSTREGPQSRNRTLSKRSSYAVEGNRNGGRGRRPKSPARVPEPPPEKRIPTSSRSVRRRDSAQVRGDPGEGPGRRSRSPASARTVTVGGGRNHLKPAGGGFRRVTPPAKAVEQGNGGGGEKFGEVENDVVPQEESLENPHVSLECFIFL